MSATTTPGDGGLLLGAVDAVVATVDAGVTVAADVHDAIARVPFAAVRLLPGVAAASVGVRLLHDGITAVVYGAVRAGVAVAGAAARLVARLAGPGRDEAPAGSAADMAIAAVNGFARDALRRAGNPLAVPMTLRHGGASVPLERTRLAAAVPDARGRLVVFVHGLACGEHIWTLRSARHYGTADSSHGTRLAADLDLTPLYVRYNTGLHVSENGAALARLLDDLVREWPVPVDELALVGHSMGGLVVRSACHQGREAALGWTRSLRHVVCLGAPHRGAPLEKAANVLAWALGRVAITRPLAALVNRRSAGIKDLRFGALSESDWRGVDPDALLSVRAREVPLLDGTAHHFVAATITRRSDHAVGALLGDLLVREPSASGGAGARTAARVWRLGGLHHLDLLNHPVVYRRLRRWLRA